MVGLECDVVRKSLTARISPLFPPPCPLPRSSSAASRASSRAPPCPHQSSSLCTPFLQQVEIAVVRALTGKPVTNRGALANPDSLDFFSSPRCLALLEELSS